MKDFNPRAPSGARLIADVLYALPSPFQSTRSERSATVRRGLHGCVARFQSTRSERSATEAHVTTGPSALFQSTRSERSATWHVADCGWWHGFQSTRSERSATFWINNHLNPRVISIHALRAERDSERPQPPTRRCAFQSTRSERSATVLHCRYRRNSSDFNPRAPSGARQHPRCRRMRR